MPAEIRIFFLNLGVISLFILLYPFSSMASLGCNVADLTIGFVGTGKISAAMARGFCSLPNKPKQILISKRNEIKANALVSEHPELIAIAENDDIVRQSDVVFVGLLPPVAREIMPHLPWTEEGSRLRLVVSMMAAVNLDEVYI